ncbi:MAG: phenylalanine--tRNA ligase subunit beta [Candidatus Levyibacteriota bacterium]
MLAPLSWLKEYVDITLSPKELGERLTEVGLGTEKIIKTDGDVIFEFEITPNRPDLLSIIGIAREIAAVENKSIKYPRLKTNLKPKKILPLIIKTDSKINPRFTGIIIDGIKVKESPTLLKDKLVKINQRPINNIVDITNYVMFELGNPIHAFDYDKIKGHIMEVKKTKGGEEFKSVDGISYHLPKGAVVIYDDQNLIDLCGIKGGFNSGTFEDTKTIFLRIPVEDAIQTRKTSQSLGLRSEASSIFERGVNTGGTVDALIRCVDIILELAGGQVVSELYDIKEKSFSPWRVDLRIERLNKILGIQIPIKEVLQILESLNFLPKIIKKNIIQTLIPTYRNDLKIEEDLIEEVARLYGYNKFPKTLPFGEIPTKQIPYFKDYRIDEKVKSILNSCGFSEVYTYSLLGEKDLIDWEINPNNILRIDNPVSKEFEYLRPTLKINLLKALRQNQANFEEINLFELGKAYLGKTVDKNTEDYYLSAVSNKKNFSEIKGLVEYIFESLGIKDDPAKYIEIIDDGIIFEINYSQILEKMNPQKKFLSIPKHPPIIEDLAIVIGNNIEVGKIIEEIKKQSPLISHVSLLDQYQNSKTFHLVYQHREKNLTNEEVAKIREKIITALKEKFHAKIKE